MPRRRVARICAHCGKDFETNPARVGYGHAKYCSRACWLASRTAPQEGRTCTVCGRYKVATAFDSNPEQRKRLRPECKECRRARARDYYRRNQEAMLERRLLATFGITRARYDALLAAQGGRCAICGTTEPGNGFVRLPVDHDHATGAVRGLLCASCNHGLGAFRDDPRRLRAALRYLAHPPARHEGGDDGPAATGGVHPSAGERDDGP